MQAEWCEIEIVVCDEAKVLSPAPARELDAIDRGVLRARQLVETTEA
jgi:hypothetical protein